MSAAPIIDDPGPRGESALSRIAHLHWTEGFWTGLLRGGIAGLLAGGIIVALAMAWLA
jgi:hypothetical protein